MKSKLWLSLIAVIAIIFFSGCGSEKNDIASQDQKVANQSEQQSTGYIDSMVKGQAQQNVESATQSENNKIK